MATYRCWAQSGVTERANSTAYSLGDRMQPSSGDSSTNNAIAKRYVWECTTAGTSGAGIPAWSTSYTVDSSTITDGAVTWTCRAPGYSSGSTVDWTFAAIYVTFITPLLAAGDSLLVHYTSQEPANGATHAIQLPAGSLLISVDKDASEAYTPMGTSGYIGNSTNNLSCNPIAAAASVHGVTFRGRATSGNNGVYLSPGDDGQLFLVDVQAELSSGASVQPIISIGTAVTGARSAVYARNLTLSRANNGQIVRMAGKVEITGGATAGATSCTSLFHVHSSTSVLGGGAVVSGFDATAGMSSSATLVVDNATFSFQLLLDGCVLPSSYTVMSGASNLNDSGSIVTLNNCKAGSTEGIHGYYTALGSATRNTTITYNGEAYSWKIDGASTSRNSPFQLPWMWGQIATGGSVTPKIEILRDDSTTALTDTEVWIETGAAVTSGSPAKTFSSTVPTYTAGGSNHAAGAGLGSWAGESGTAWSGKISGAAVTPVGDEYQMRLCVATTTSIYAAQGWET